MSFSTACSLPLSVEAHPPMRTSRRKMPVRLTIQRPTASGKSPAGAAFTSGAALHVILLCQALIYFVTLSVHPSRSILDQLSRPTPEPQSSTVHHASTHASTSPSLDTTTSPHHQFPSPILLELTRTTAATMSNPNQLFLLADHIKLSLLERKRAQSLNLDNTSASGPGSQDGHISRSLEQFRDGLSALSEEKARLEQEGDTRLASPDPRKAAQSLSSSWPDAPFGHATQ